MVFAHIGFFELAVGLLFPCVATGALLRRKGWPVVRVWIPFVLFTVPVALEWNPSGAETPITWILAAVMTLGLWVALHAGARTTTRQRADAALVGLPLLSLAVTSPTPFGAEGWAVLGSGGVACVGIRLMATGRRRTAFLLVWALAAVGCGLAAARILSGVGPGTFRASYLVSPLLWPTIFAFALAISVATAQRLEWRVDDLRTRALAARERSLVRAQGPRLTLLLAALGVPVLWLLDASTLTSFDRTWGIWGGANVTSNAATYGASLCLVAWVGVMPLPPRSTGIRPAALALVGGSIFCVAWWLFGRAPSEVVLVVAAIVGPCALLPRNGSAWLAGLGLLGALGGSMWLPTEFAWALASLLGAVLSRCAVVTELKLRWVLVAMLSGDLIWFLVAPHLAAYQEFAEWVQSDPVGEWSRIYGPQALGFALAWPCVLVVRRLSSATAVPLEHPIYADFGGPVSPVPDADISPGGSARSGSTSPA